MGESLSCCQNSHILHGNTSIRINNQEGVETHAEFIILSQQVI